MYQTNNFQFKRKKFIKNQNMIIIEYNENDNRILMLQYETRTITRRNAYNRNVARRTNFLRKFKYSSKFSVTVFIFLHKYR